MMFLIMHFSPVSCCQGLIQGGAAAVLQSPPPKPEKPKFKKQRFLNIMTSKVLRDFPLGRNQPLKSVDDQYIRILKNKLIK
jgi:hypothetical protein